MSWNEDGSGKGEFMVGQWQGGKAEIVLPEEVATSEKIIPGLQARRMTELVQTLILGVLIGGVYALLASGLTLIFGVMRVINIAHGAFLILAAFLTYTIWSATGIDPLVSILFTTPIMFALRLAGVRRRGAPRCAARTSRRRCC